MIHEISRDRTRQDTGKEILSNPGFTDSQHVKTTRSGGLYRGTDGGKKVKGRKRHINN